MAVGSGKADDKGNVVKPSLSVGDTVLYSKYAGVEFEVSPFYGSSSLLACFAGIRSPSKAPSLVLKWYAFVDPEGPQSIKLPHAGKDVLSLLQSLMRHSGNACLPA